MNYKFYIININNDEILGTNNERVALKCSKDNNFYVIDTSINSMLYKEKKFTIKEYSDILTEKE